MKLPEISPGFGETTLLRGIMKISLNYWAAMCQVDLLLGFGGFKSQIK